MRPSGVTHGGAAAGPAPQGHALVREGAVLCGVDVGAGLPVLFQHGLGGAEAQAAENFPADDGLRRLTLECRGHGASLAGDRRPFSIAMFAEDALAFAAARGVARFVAGGVSMGAAIALRLAVRYPTRVGGLILVRPAWAFEAAPTSLHAHREMAELVARLPLAEARDAFARGPTAALLAHEAPGNLATLLRFFDRPDPLLMAALCADIGADGAGVSHGEVAALRVPTLVIGDASDTAHPLATARALESVIPGAALVVVPPRTRDKAIHLQAVRTAIAGFLQGFNAPR